MKFQPGVSLVQGKPEIFLRGISNILLEFLYYIVIYIPTKHMNFYDLQGKPNENSLHCPKQEKRHHKKMC
jgi:hypothetical protein